MHPKSPTGRGAIRALAIPALLLCALVAAAPVAAQVSHVQVRPPNAYVCAAPGSAYTIAVSSEFDPLRGIDAGRPLEYFVGAEALFPKPGDRGTVRKSFSEIRVGPLAYGGSTEASISLPDGPVGGQRALSGLVSVGARLFSQVPGITMTVPGIAQPIVALHYDVDRRSMGIGRTGHSVVDGLWGTVWAHGFGTSTVWLHAKRKGTRKWRTVKLGKSLRGSGSGGMRDGLTHHSARCGTVNSLNPVGGKGKLFPRPGAYTVVATASKRSRKATKLTTRTVRVKRGS